MEVLVDLQYQITENERELGRGERCAECIMRSILIVCSSFLGTLPEFLECAVLNFTPMEFKLICYFLATDTKEN
jgi:hypothetical protein